MPVLRDVAFGVSPSRAALTARSRAMRAREPGQVRKEAALSGSGHVPRTSLARANRDASARGPVSRSGRTVLPSYGGARAPRLPAVRDRRCELGLEAGGGDPT